MLIDDVKDYLRVDSDIDDDTQIVALITAAKQYIINQTGKKYIETDEVWNLAIKMLVAHWYENRELHPSKPGTLATNSHTADALISHISLCSAYPKVGDSP